MSSSPVVCPDAVNLPPWDQVRQCCLASPLGKRLPDALYLHRSALSHLDPILQAVAAAAQTYLPQDFEPTLIKFQFRQPRLSWLLYPDFDDDPHPALHLSVQVDFSSGTVQQRSYHQTPNPPILHRKETLVAPDHPQFHRFQDLTRQEESLGLLQDPRRIGTRSHWQQRLQTAGLELHGHHLACPRTGAPAAPEPLESPRLDRPIDRHKAAIHRNALSRPLRLALEAGLLAPNCTVFDYGCGHGGDLERMAQAGYRVSGWDPYYQPDRPRTPAEVVNLGYVINVIEDLGERRQALRAAWHLTQGILIVSAQVVVETAQQGSIAYEDGVITQRYTFQKYYQQEELKTYIDQVLEVDAIALGLGIYGVFRDASQRENFRASRFRSRAKTPCIRTQVNHFENHKILLQPLMEFYNHRGRLPTALEVSSRSDFQQIQDTFKSLKQAFAVIVKATDSHDWEAIREQRRQDWLVYLALGKFGTLPRFSDLDATNQADIKTLFGSYTQACDAAQIMLLALGDLSGIRDSCQRSGIGQLHDNSLWIHYQYLDQLEPVLRLYEGCGALTFGRLEQGTIVKIHWTKAALTYYAIPDFDRDPHPCIHSCMKIDLKSAQVYWQDYRSFENPPILVGKDQLVQPDYPHYGKFLKLSQQEYTWGLLEGDDTPVSWWTQRDWQRRLVQQGAQLQGHRLVWRKDLDPYRRKVLQSQQRSRLKALNTQPDPPS